MKPSRGCSSISDRASGVSGPGQSHGRDGQREAADGAQKRRDDDHVSPALVEPQLLGQQTRVNRQLARLTVQHRVVRRDRLGEDAHGRAVRVSQLVLQPAVVERRTGVISERQQQLVADLLEASGAVRADDHPVEAIAQIERDGDERVDLPVGGGGVLGIGTTRIVLAQDLVSREHGAPEALRQRALRRIVLEAVGQHHVQRAVAVVVVA